MRHEMAVCVRHLCEMPARHVESGRIVFCSMHEGVRL